MDFMQQRHGKQQQQQQSASSSAKMSSHRRQQVEAVDPLALPEVCSFTFVVFSYWSMPPPSCLCYPPFAFPAKHQWLSVSRCVVLFPCDGNADALSFESNSMFSLYGSV